MSDQGWGSTTAYLDSQSAVLLEVEQPVVSNAECETSHRTIAEQIINNITNNITIAEQLPNNITINDLIELNTPPITEGMICAGGVAGEGTCYVRC